jgi:hypothetical protein
MGLLPQQGRHQIADLPMVREEELIESMGTSEKTAEQLGF